MSSKPSFKVYRATYLPSHVDRLAAAELLAGCIPGLEMRDIQVGSLATSVDCWPNKTATVMFRAVPDVLNKDTSQAKWEFRVSGLPGPIVLDTHFYGLTPLNDVHETIHTNDCVVISGLGSHPMGSWQPRGDKAFMWIRDSLPGLLPGIRFIIYGYDTKLPGSKSFQTIPDLARSFIACLQAGDWVSKPLFFLAHSLGGVLVKQSIVALAGNKESEQHILHTTIGAVFFGVPSVGMAVQDLYDMLGEQPNKALLDYLSDRTDYVPRLEEDFKRVSTQRMKIVWAYETQETPSLSNSGGGWRRAGPGVLMVSPSSATGGRHNTSTGGPMPVSSNDEMIVQIDADHSNMVKFTIGDQLINTLADKIRRILLSGIHGQNSSHLEENQARATSAPKSTSSFRERCRDLLCGLSQSTTLPVDTEGTFVRTFDIVAGASKFLDVSDKIIKLSTYIRHQVQNEQAPIGEWIESLEDLRWLFKEMRACSPAQSTRTICILNSCTNSCSEILDVLESIRLSTTGFFQRAPTRNSLQQILSSSNNREAMIRAGFTELIRNQSVLIIALELLMVELTPHTFRKLKDPLDLTTEESECIGALRITDPSRDREGLITDKGEIVQGTCTWILSTHQFETWIEGSKLPLWISAPPGMGKTYMSIFLSRRLQRLCEVRNNNSIAIFFFCDNKVETRNTGSNLLRGLIYQLIQWRKELIKVPLQQWKIQGDVFSRNDSFQSLWEIFEDMVDSLPGITVYCLLDAMDECERESALLLKKFNQLLETRSNIKLIVASRRHPDYISEALAASITIKIDQDSTARGDIERYIAERVRHLAVIKQFAEEPLQQYVEEVFLEKAQDTFLWVSFMIHELLQKTVAEIESSLRELPTGLDAVYDRIFSQIGPKKKETILKMLGWIALAVRPLAVSELCSALYIQPTAHLTPERVCLDYISSCGHLLQVTAVEPGVLWHLRSDMFEKASVDGLEDDGGAYMCDRDGDKFEVSLYYQQQVTLVHQSAKDYLLENIGRPGAKSRIGDRQRIHEEIASRLLHEMAGGCLEYPEWYRNWVLPRIWEWPLAIYAITNWQTHFNQAQRYEELAQVHEAFFRERCSTLRDKWFQCLQGGSSTGPIPLLHLASKLDLVAPARRLLQLKKERLGVGDLELYVNRKWDGGSYVGTVTALHRACKLRRVEMVNLLLEYGADPTRGRDHNGMTPLHVACEFLDEPTLFARMIESKGGRELVEKEGGQLLYEAASYGHNGLCRLLIERYGVQVDRPGESGSGLEGALRGGHTDLAYMFVNEWHASTDQHGRLLQAIMSMISRWKANPINFGWEANPNRYQTFFEIVQAWRINPNATCPNGQGLIHDGNFWQYISKEHAVLLLRLGLDPSTRDLVIGRTVLHAVTEMVFFTPVFNMEVLKVLLQDGRLKINTQDFRGQTLLHCITLWSVESHRCDHVKNLCQNIMQALDLGSDRNLRDAGGKTPLDLVYKYADNWTDSSISDTTSSSDRSTDVEEAIEIMQGAIEILRDYATVPLFSDWAERVDVENTDSTGKADTATQKRTARKIQGRTVWSIHQRRRPWLGGSRRRRAIRLRGRACLSVADNSYARCL